MIHGFGVSREGCLVDMGTEAGILEKAGTWILFKGERLGQGRENAKEFLKANPKTADEIEKALKARFLTVGQAQPEAAPAKVAAGRGEPQRGPIPETRAPTRAGSR
jgi:recombination protein RecA